MADLNMQMKLFGALVDFEFAWGGGVDAALGRALERSRDLPGALFSSLTPAAGEGPLELLRRAAAELEYFPLAVLAESCAAAARGELGGRLSAGASAYLL